jgi:hypothetical protein
LGSPAALGSAGALIGRVFDTYSAFTHVTPSLQSAPAANPLAWDPQFLVSISHEHARESTPTRNWLGPVGLAPCIGRLETAQLRGHPNAKPALLKELYVVLCRPFTSEGRIASGRKWQVSYSDF